MYIVHDHIPLCIDCHRQAMVAQDIMRENLCRKYNVPHFKVQQKSEEYIKLFTAKKAASALSKKHTIPNKRKVVLLEQICDFYGLEYEIVDSEENEQKMDDNQLRFGSLIKIKNGGNKRGDVLGICIDELNEMQIESIDAKQWKIHSKKLVEVFKSDEIGFIEMWRNAFIDNMEPRFLPEIWNVSPANI